MTGLVYAIVLNWNGWRDTTRCLRSLAAGDYPRLHVVVVDNGSTDDSCEQLRHVLADMDGELIEVGYNAGFTGGVNVGLRRALDAGAGYAFLLNNDATVAPDCLSRLVAALEECPAAGLAGPSIRWADQPGHLWSGGVSINWPRAAVYAHRDEPACGQLDGRRLVQGLSGCALLVRRAVLERAGLLDERYFMYYEDLDWCLRARRAGYRCLYAGDARACHDGSASSNRGAGASQSPFLNYYAARNGLLFMATHAPARVRPLALACLLGAMLAAEARIVAGGLVLRRPYALARARAIALGVLDAARGRFGNTATPPSSRSDTREEAEGKP